MPELPELVNYKNYVDSTSLHQQIEQIEVHNDNVLKNCTESELQEALTDQTFESTSRYGKYLFIHTDSGKISLVWHFGMTGNPAYYKDEEDQPEHARLVVSFSNGYHLAYNCPRMLGEINLTEDLEEFIAEKSLGPDVYKEDFDFEKFKSLLEDRRGMIKSALMDQELMAGIGNECSDEILFQAGIHPKKNVGNLSDDQLENIFDSMHEVLDHKIDADMKDQPLPEYYILNNREEGADCPKCGGTIEKITVSGRSGYYCPACQQK